VRVLPQNPDLRTTEKTMTFREFINSPWEFLYTMAAVFGVIITAMSGSTPLFLVALGVFFAWILLVCKMARP
jgi:hypothetical protein